AGDRVVRARSAVGGGPRCGVGGDGWRAGAAPVEGVDCRSTGDQAVPQPPRIGGGGQCGGSESAVPPATTGRVRSHWVPLGNEGRIGGVMAGFIEAVLDGFTDEQLVKFLILDAARLLDREED